MLVFKFICGSIKERIGYDLMELNPINYCSRMNTPIIFFVGKDDNLVLPERVKQMHDAYSGHKHLIVTNGSHESFRQPLELEEIFNRIQTFYGKEKKITSPKKVRGEDPKFIRENPILQQLNEFNINIPELEKNKTELLKMSNKIDLARGSDNKNFVDPFAQSSKKASNDPWSAETGGLSKLNTSSRSSQQFNVYDPSNYSNILETQEKGNEYHKYKNANLQIGKKVHQPLIGRPGISSSNKIEVATSLTTMVPISNEFDEFSGDNYYNEGLLTDPFPVKKNQPQSMMRKRH